MPTDKKKPTKAKASPVEEEAKPVVDQPSAVVEEPVVDEQAIADKFIYRVRFHTGQEEYFTSLAAIFESFSEEEIGVTLGYLYNRKVCDGVPFANAKVYITRHPLHSKPQKSPKNRS